MSTPTSKLRSLSRENRFAFPCPIFGTNVELRGCLRLHELHMVGNGPETRLGCQAAMSSSKCPIWHMQQMMRQGRDDWHSDEPKVGSLGSELVTRIARVQTSEKQCNEHRVPPHEAKLLLEANSMWERGVAKAGKAPPATAAATGQAAPAPPKAGKKSPKSEIANAARTGDLAAAINEAAAA